VIGHSLSKEISMTATPQDTSTDLTVQQSAPSMQRMQDAPLQTTSRDTKISVIARFASRFGMEPEKVLATLKATAFRSKDPATNEQMMALMIVAEQYSLNPFTKELYAFPDERAGIVPVVSIDGWTRIMQEAKAFNGYDVRWSEETVEWEGKQVPSWCEITIYRRDIEHQITHREWFDEVRRNTGPWKSHPRRLLEHKTLIQTARRAFGFAGIYDEDEAARITEATVVTLPKESAVTQINATLKAG
jgi:phage recombination protein Bet